MTSPTPPEVSAALAAMFHRRCHVPEGEARDAYMADLRAIDAHIATLKARLAEAGRDAARYRWMRTVYADLRGIHGLAEEAFDEAIAALKDTHER